MRPRTETGRDAMLLAAAEAAAERVMRQRGGKYSAEFITGLAGALGACALSTTCCACSTCTGMAIPAHQSCYSVGTSLHRGDTLVSANADSGLPQHKVQYVCMLDWNMHTDGCW